MLNIETINLKYKTKDELIKLSEELIRDNKRKEHYIDELEYRLEKLNIKTVISTFEYDEPYNSLEKRHLSIRRHYIPEFIYTEYIDCD